MVAAPEIPEIANIVNIKVIETSPNINVKLNGELILDFVYTDYDLKNQIQNNFTLSHLIYNFADVFIQGIELTINGQSYGNGIVYFLKQPLNTSFSISGTIEKMYVIYHNGFWSDVECNNEEES